MARSTIVVPCYNEAFRFDAEAFSLALSADPELNLVFSNDGSTDDTLARLRELEMSHRDRVSVIDQQPNKGKPEAVRVGMLSAFRGEADFVGYFDADLSTPLNEISRFVEVFDAHPELEIVIGSRVNLLGRSIERRAWRHYLGRIAATVTSITLRLSVYDTQCGAKLFRNDDAMRALFDAPFRSGWVFDVELIARLIRDRRAQGLSGAAEVLYELPLDQWHEVAGSKVGPTAPLRALIDMFRIHSRYLRS